MSNSIDEAFTRRFNEAYDAYEEDRLEECIEKARQLLADNAIPPYHRMKTLVLLGSCLGDWDEANACCEKARSLWRIVKRWHPAGEDAKVDEAVEEIRQAIAELEEALDTAEDSPENYQSYRPRTSGRRWRTP